MKSIAGRVVGILQNAKTSFHVWCRTAPQTACTSPPKVSRKAKTLAGYPECLAAPAP